MLSPMGMALGTLSFEVSAIKRQEYVWGTTNKLVHKLKVVSNQKMHNVLHRHNESWIYVSDKTNDRRLLPELVHSSLSRLVLQPKRLEWCSLGSLIAYRLKNNLVEPWEDSSTEAIAF